MPNFKFKKVKTLPTSGYSTGDIYFVSSEKKIYIRTESGWEDYGGASGGVTSLGGKTGDILLDTSADGSTRIGFEIETGPVAGGIAKTLVGKLPAMKTINKQSLVGSGDITTGDVTKAGTNIFTGYNRFSAGVESPNFNLEYVTEATYYKAISIKCDVFGEVAFVDNIDADPVLLKNIHSPKSDNDAANKKYVDDKVAAAGGLTSPVLIDLAELSGEVGTTMSLDIYNELVEAAKSSTPVFGYLENTESGKTTYALVPLSVTHISSTSLALTINYIRANAAHNIGIMKRSDTECRIMINSSRSLALATSVSNASSVAVQSDAVWKAIHAEPMTVNTATSGVTSLTLSSNHKILCNVTSGTQQYNLPASPLDGETFTFLKVNSGHTLVIQSGTGNSNVFDCASGTSNISKTIGSTTKRKITVTYSSSAGKWFVMCDDFLS